MKNLLVALSFGVLVSCNNESDRSDPAEFVPVTGFLQGQIAEAEASMGSMIKVEKSGTRSDTAVIDRKTFKAYAAPFASLPDITEARHRDDYEAASMFDDLLNAYVFTYTSRDADKEIQRQHVVVAPVGDGTNIIQAITVNRRVKDEKAQQTETLVWETGNRFVITRQDEKGQVRSIEIKWNYLPEGF